MTFHDFSRSKALNNIPEKKLEHKLKSIELSNDSIDVKNLKSVIYNRYAESNIPIEYWDLRMDKDFVGDPKLLDKYNDLVSDLKGHYIAGTSICFAGSHGVGKSLATTNILKKACQKGFSCLYSDISMIVSVLTQASNEDKFLARRELCLTDFLVIDEVDYRFFSSDASSELFAKTLEGVFRSRRQNKLPTFICTNSPNILEGFDGPLKQSLDSLFSDKLKVFYVLDKDYRKKTFVKETV